MAAESAKLVCLVKAQSHNKRSVPIMHFKVYNDVNNFYDATYDLLMCHEAQNLIPLGNIILGKEGKDKSGWRDPVNWYMATISNSDGVLLVAIMTPPHNITLYAKDNKINESAVSCLVDHIGGYACSRRDGKKRHGTPLCRSLLHNKRAEI